MSPQSSHSDKPSISLLDLVDDVIGHPYLPLVIKKVFDVCGSNAFDSSKLKPHFSEAELNVAKWQKFAETEGFKSACELCKTSTDAIMFIMVTALNRVSAAGSADHVALQTTITTGRKALSNTWNDPRFIENTENGQTEGVGKPRPIPKGESIHQPDTTRTDVDNIESCHGIRRLGGIQKPVSVTRTPLSEKAKATLEKWFQDHVENPYPTGKQKENLATSCGVTLASVNNWFGNKRMRIKRKMLQVESQGGGRITDKVLAPRSKWNAVVVSKMSSQMGREVLASATGTAINARENGSFYEGHSMHARERVEPSGPGRPENTK